MFGECLGCPVGYRSDRDVFGLVMIHWIFCNSGGYVISDKSKLNQIES